MSFLLVYLKIPHEKILSVGYHLHETARKAKISSIQRQESYHTREGRGIQQMYANCELLNLCTIFIPSHLRLLLGAFLFFLLHKNGPLFTHTSQGQLRKNYYGYE